MRISIDYTAGIQQSAGVGRFVRGLVGALLSIDPDNAYTLLYAPTSRGKAMPYLPSGPNVASCSYILSEKVLNFIWYKVGIPLPLDLVGGVADLYHFPDFALPPMRAREERHHRPRFVILAGPRLRRRWAPKPSGASGSGRRFATLISSQRIRKTPVMS